MGQLKPRKSRIRHTSHITPRRRGRWGLLLPVFAVLVLLGVTLLRPAPTPNLPDGAELRGQMARLESDFLEDLDALCTRVPHDSFSVVGTGEGGLLLTNRLEMAAVTVASGKPLEEVFSAMATLTWETRRMDSQSVPLFPAANGELPSGGEKTALVVSVRCLSAQEGAEALDLSWRERQSMGQLLETRETLNTLLCPPLVPTGEAAEWLSDLPQTLSPLRRAFVSHVLSLTGQVPYFWGGKSACTGWDMGWNSPALIRAAGVSESGTVQPYGLDCSGLVSWAAVAATEDSGAYALVGDGVRQQFSACTPVALSQVQPGDLLFFPDLSHIGIAAGWSETGSLRVVHCSRSLGGVVLGADAAAVGFTTAGQPALFQADIVKTSE